MGWLKKIALKLFGKKIVEDGIEKVGLSKTKATAIIFVLITGIESLSAAWGTPIEVPPGVKEFLAATGLWAMRDAVK